jgi:hypothetical protein
MKRKGILAAIAAIFGLVGVGMAVTNPNQAAYETFATEQLTVYLQDNVCKKVPVGFNLNQQCRSALRSNQDQLRQLISESTKRQNFGLFSLYTTDLSIDSWLPAYLSASLPSYHIETAAAFQNFYIYQAKQQ